MIFIKYSSLAARRLPWQHKAGFVRLYAVTGEFLSNDFYDGFFYDGFLTHLRARYPKTSAALNIEDRLSPFLISPHKVQLPESVKDQAVSIVKAFSELRDDHERDTRLSAQIPETPAPGNASALMSYDFHVDVAGNLRLIEINTNASLSLIVSTLYRYQNVRNIFSDNFEAEILKTFENEYLMHELSSQRKLVRIAIADESPEEQKMFIEFKFFQELFESSGYETVIVDPSQLKFDGVLHASDFNIDLIYNRHTDFYFEKPQSSAMREAFVKKGAVFSPNPHEYRLLADKARLLELSDPANRDLGKLSPNHRAILAKTLIPTFEIASFGSPDEMWKKRKAYFFKPKRMFGGKAVYKGASITRSVFNDVYSENYLAQENVPAPKLTFSGEEFKFDLRFFAYRDKIQLACARLYRGQTTNSGTLGGGSAVIDWS
jgi:hypothetical protein